MSYDEKIMSKVAGADRKFLATDDRASDLVSRWAERQKEADAEINQPPARAGLHITVNHVEGEVAMVVELEGKHKLPILMTPMVALKLAKLIKRSARKAGVVAHNSRA